MGLRKLTKDHPGYSAAAALVVLAGVGYYMFNSLGGSDRTGMDQPVYLYDLQTGERFRGKLNDYPPTDAPSGAGNGVRVYVFGCGSCDEEKLVNGYLEKYTPEGREAALNARQSFAAGDVDESRRLDELAAQNKLVRAVDGEQWFPSTSTQGRKIILEAGGRACPGTVAFPCQPGQKAPR